jgi:hypothetical protein
MIQQRLDFLGVSFRCLECKEIGHLKHQCRGDSKKAVLGCYDVFGETNAAELNFPTEEWIVNKSSSTEESDLVTGKLKQFCPNFTSLLSVNVEGGKKIFGSESSKPICCFK